MIVLVIGSVLIVVGAVSISFVSLAKTLEEHDKVQWLKLGSPRGTSFVDLGKTIGIFSWVLSRGFEASPSKKVQEQGKSDLTRALFAKYSMLVGVLCVFVGFALGLASI
ncbi:hypothetical protein [Teredinibacter sp. KSP-S5-2]|uniref:hypothetical protein n=1 Tax=Teredinibacter sp. KSP-S5-2 TaxID=3034506 RepID=UPI0029350634|nr:hypothetical protein [Teredinibacter sp. KSP-S5-2]WNO11172.1 hypothetical protein P5V12_08300 [Teredinibacter sp. KSP-S5-2]